MVSIPREIQVEVIIKVILETILLISQDLIFLEMVVGHNAKFVTNMVNCYYRFDHSFQPSVNNQLVAMITSHSGVGDYN